MTEVAEFFRQRRVRARGLQAAARIPIPCRPGLSVLLLILAFVTFQAFADDTATTGDNASNSVPASPPADSQIPAPLTDGLTNPAPTLPVTASNTDTGTLSDTPPTGQPAADTTAPEPGQLPTPGIASYVATNAIAQAKTFKEQLDDARKLRSDKNPGDAAKELAVLLDGAAPPEIKRDALFEMALVAQDENQLVKAEQIFAQYLHLYPDEPTAPEVLLRQGLIYRQMGVTSLAISKFYAVMSTALKLKLDNMDYYKKLVLQAQIEIADTYYLEGQFKEASDYFARLLKNPPPDLDREQIQYKLIRSLSALTNSDETVARAQVFLDLYTNSLDVPEVRFLLASSLKQLGRNQDSLKQVLLLLQTERENVDKNPGFPGRIGSGAPASKSPANSPGKAITSMPCKSTSTSRTSTNRRPGRCPSGIRPA